MSDVTRLLDRVEKGDATAAGELLPLVYSELRRLAAHKMRGEAAGHTLQATALVHEAWLKLVGGGREHWANRGHFFLAAAEAMRRILIDQARRRASQRRGGGKDIESLDESSIECNAPSDEVLAVHEALDALASNYPISAEVVKMRYFAGMSIPEVADALRVAPSTVDREWAFARAWLKRAIED